MNNSLDIEKLRSIVSETVAQRWGNQNSLDRLTEVVRTHLLKDGSLVRGLKRANVFEGVQTSLHSNDVIGALTTIASAQDRTVPKNPRKIITAAAKEISVRSREKDEDRVTETAGPSTAQLAGQGAHEQVEKIISHPDNLDKVLAQNVTLVGNGEITEVIFNQKVPEAEPQQVGFLAFVEAKKTEPPTIQRIHLTQPLPPPLPSQTLVDWGAKLIEETRQKIYDSGAKLPETPDEVIDILNHPEAGKYLTQLVEIGHILCDNPSRLNLVERNTSGRYQITDRDGIRTLNWLSINRLIEQAVKKELPGIWQSANDSEELTTPSEWAAHHEMTIGKIKYLIPATQHSQEKLLVVNGGRIDSIELHFPNKNGRVPLKILADQLEAGEFGSQLSRHHRKRFVDGKWQIYQSTLFRRTDNLLSQLWKQYHNDLFSELSLMTEDIKMISGDATRDTVLDVHSPLDDRHIQQVKDYVFFIASQLCALEKRASNSPTLFNSDSVEEGDLPSVTANEVAQFINKYNLFNRFQGRLRYELPQQTVLHPIGLPLPEEVAGWCQQIIDRKVETAERYELQRLASSTLRRVTNDIEVQKIPRERRKIPDEFSRLCGETTERVPRLILKDLERLLTSPENEITIDTAVAYQEEKVFALWFRGLLPRNEVLRIAIDLHRGRFVASSINGQYKLFGSLSSERSKAKVKENTQALVKLFETEVWAKICQLAQNSVQVSSSLDRENLVDKEGNVGPAPAGFPLLFTIDPLTNQWKFNFDELENGLKKVKETGLDPHGLLDWAIVVNRWKAGERYFRKSLRCGFWTHKSPTGDPNTDTPAAAMMGTHGHCFSCGENFYLPLLPGEQLPVPAASGDKLYHYRGVSNERWEAFHRGQILSELFAKYNPTARDYIASRGINPDNIGPFGYNPPDLSIALARLLPRRPKKGDTSQEAQERQKSLNEFTNWVRTNHLGDFSLDQLIKVPDCPKEIKERANAVISALNFLPNDTEESPRREALDILTVKNIRLLKNRGIIREKFAGRLQLPTYWFPLGLKDGEKPQLLIANYNSRVMTTKNENEPVDESVIEEEDIDESADNFLDKTQALTLAKGEKKEARKYLKVQSGRRGKPIQIQEGDELITIHQLTTPPGIWVPNVEKFLAQAYNGNDEFVGMEEVIIFEGILNAAAYYTVFPEVKDRCLAICGTGHFAVVPLLKTLKAKRAIIALDLDAPGRKAAERLMKLLDTNLGPDLEITHIAEILPPEFRPEIINDTTKADMNDLLLTTELGKRYRFRPE